MTTRQTRQAQLGLFTIADVARKLNMTQNAVWNLVHRSKTIEAPAVPYGKRLYYSQAAFERIIAAEEALMEQLA